MNKIKPKKSKYMWVRISFYYASTFFNIPNCYAKIWIDEDATFPPEDKFLILEDIVLPMQALDEKKRPVAGDTNLVALKNMKDTFPGNQGKLYVNTFQIASIMPLDLNSEMVKNLDRVTSVSTLPTDAELSRLKIAGAHQEKIVRMDRGIDEQ
ncbi:hypothetical protein FJZ31_01025 [Candidatus Poribacteria bacterium]|nr:hypothetical protein [Candidatus Poribacteria bacterium]